MDKYEYKLCSEEIKSLIKKREFTKAVEIADTVDWSRVRSVNTLCTISDLYKINRRYKESKVLLQQAYERYPGGRMIVYSLCELCIKMDEIVQAIEYYKEFVQMAPTDNGKFILQYKIYEAQDVSLEERIAVLEELKKREYREKWGYELAYLYHRIGLTTKCVEECDELILWFREGKYVRKAMELKMLHQALSTEQESLYRTMLPGREKQAHIEQTTVYQKVDKPAAEEPEIHVKTMDVSKYNTINLQKELAESMKDVLVAENGFKPFNEEHMPKEAEPDEEESHPGQVTQAIMAPMMQDTGEMEELFYEENEEEPSKPEITETDTKKPTEAAKDPIEELINKKVAEAVKSAVKAERPSIREVMETSLPTPDMSKIDPPSFMGRLLSQEYDGQIRLVVPEGEKVEKQITGQMDLSEILAEWEKTKKQNEDKRKEEVKKRVLEQTGNLFTDFDAKARDGILEKLERESEMDSSDMDIDEEYNNYIEQIMREDEQNSVLEDNLPNEVPIILEEVSNNIEGESEISHEESEISHEEPEIPQEVPAVSQETTDVEVKPEIIPEETVEEELPEVEELEEIQEPGEDDSQSEEDSRLEDEVPLEEESQPKDDTQLENESKPKNDTQPEEKAQEPEEKADEPVEEILSSRILSEEEAALFKPFIQTKSAKNRLLHALDSISLAAYTGNVFVTGETHEETIELAKNVVREIQMTDSNFSGKIAKATGSSLNTKEVATSVEKLVNGGLIIENAGGMSETTVTNLIKSLNQEKTGIVVVLQDTRKVMNKMMEHYPDLQKIFNVHIEVEELSDDALVAYGKKYAEHLEYSIDEVGILALHTRIDELQTSDHIVTVSDIRDIVNEAIKHANKKSLKHFSDVLFAKRYDDDDMIILREKDFVE